MFSHFGKYGNKICMKFQSISRVEQVFELLGGLERKDSEVLSRWREIKVATFLTRNILPSYFLLA